MLRLAAPPSPHLYRNLSRAFVRAARNFHTLPYPLNTRPAGRGCTAIAPWQPLCAARPGLVLARSNVFPGGLPVGVAFFHSTSIRKGPPMLVLLLGALKSSATMEFVRTAARVAFTFLPFLAFKNCFARKYITHHQYFPGAEPPSDEKTAMILKRIRARTIISNTLLLIPVVLFWIAILASAERTPLTGRWRLIILSPEEEDDIAAQLAGPKWYYAVSDILSTDGPPKLITADDWRYRWVQDTLRRLENVIPVLQHESELDDHWLDTGSDQPPLPPPAEYPLRPRPRATDSMRKFTETLCGRKSSSSAHVIAGPPYSLLVVDKPDASNAFSYGFGPDGASGIVVYSGFIDDILRRIPLDASPRNSVQTSWWRHIFGSFLSISSQNSSMRSHSIPTEEQTAELAILLAHEVSHLVLSHHLETLSSGSIIAPAVFSLILDVARTLTFPITMLFGPFVNDAVAQIGKFGSRELTKLGVYCTSMKQEFEADSVSLRILAHAGFDPRLAVAFWENREDARKVAECSSAVQSESGWKLARRIMGATHPVHGVRIEKLKSELLRWELERRAALHMKKVGNVEKRMIVGLV